MSSHARPHLRVIVLKLALVWSSIFLIGIGRCEAFQIQESDPEQKSLVTVKDLTLIGGYRVPNFFIDGKNIVSALGSMDLRWDENGEAVWIVQHGSGHLIELREPEAMGTGSTEDYPDMIYTGRECKPLVGQKVWPWACMWYGKGGDWVLASGRESYRTTEYDPVWLARMNLDTGEEVRYSLEIPEAGKNANFHMMQSFGAGFCRIPQEFADAHTGGRTIGLGQGGYDVLGSPLGPALAAWRPTDKYVTEIIYDYPQDNPCRRDDQYQYPVDSDGNRTGSLGIWRDPDAGGGYWQAGKCTNAAWITHPEFKGVVNIAMQGRGTLDYRAQGDSGGSLGTFVVNNPPHFYSEDSSGCRGGHCYETWNQDLPAGYKVAVVYVHDPDEFPDVLSGQKKPWELSHTRSDFVWDARISKDRNPSRPTMPRGVFWDDKRQLLWVWIDNAKNEKYPVICAYRLGTDDSSDGDTAPPSGGATDGGSTDGGSTDGGSTDGGSTDGGSTDGGTGEAPTDGGTTGGGTGEAPPDSGSTTDPPSSGDTPDPPTSGGTEETPTDNGSETTMPPSEPPESPPSGDAVDQPAQPSPSDRESRWERERRRHREAHLRNMLHHIEEMIREIHEDNKSVSDAHRRAHDRILKRLARRRSELLKQLGVNDSIQQAATDGEVQNIAASGEASPVDTSAPLLDGEILRRSFAGKWGIPASTDRIVRNRSMQGSRGIHHHDGTGNLVVATGDRDLYGLGVFRRPRRTSTSRRLRDIPAGDFLGWRTVPRTSNEPHAGGTELNGLLEREGVLHWTMKSADVENKDDNPTQGFLDANKPHGLFRVSDAHHNKVGGYLADCPSDLDGDYLCGFCGPTGIDTASGGPSLFLIDVDSNLSAWESLPSVPLLEYGNEEETRLSLFSGTTRIFGCAWIETKTVRGVVFSVSTGVGEQWFGDSIHINKSGQLLVDPYGGGPGYHSNLYEQQLWIYDPDDLREVFRKELTPDQPRPLAIIPLTEYEAIDSRNQPVALSYRNARLTVTLANGFRAPFQQNGWQPLVLEFEF